MVSQLQGRADGSGKRVAIAVARFNEVVTERLLAGALQALREAGVDDGDVTVCWVPGAFELPQCCHWLAASGRYDAVVALGAVVRGDTDHYQFVCDGATHGVVRAQLDTGVPIGFGLLTCTEMAQALERAGGGAGNKGADAAQAALAMASLRTALPPARGKPPATR